MRILALCLMFLPAVSQADPVAQTTAGLSLSTDNTVPPMSLSDHATLPRPPLVRPEPPPPPPPPPPVTVLPLNYPRPPVREANLPRTRWSHMAGHALWNRVAISALKSHGQPLIETVPRDIDDWCPHYPEATTRQRRAFWVGLMSALAKHESTYKQAAVGGGGQWYGLLQIFPGTARSYRCNATSGESLRKGGPNLSCAVRIMARTVPRDGVIAAREGRWRGVAADWAPMRVGSKRHDMQAWLKRQPYCQSVAVVRPRLRPMDLAPMDLGPVDLGPMDFGPK